MLNDKENIDHLFSEKLRNYEKNPPVYLWDDIEKGLAGKKRKTGFIRMLAVAATLLSAISAGWWLTQSYSGKEKAAAELISFTWNKPESKEEDVLHAREDAVTNSVANNEVKREKINRSFASMASFAANPSVLNQNDKEVTGGGNIVLSGTETEFLNHFRVDKDMLKKITSVFSFNGVNLKQPTENRNVDAVLTQGGTRKEVIVERNSFSPENTEPVNENHRWSVNVGFSPVFSNLNGNNQANTSARNKVSGGLTASYLLGKRIAIKTGVIFTQFNQRTADINSSTYGLSTNAGFVNYNRVSAQEVDQLLGINQQADLVQEFKYVEIPVLASYRVIEGKIHLGLEGGISTNILAGNSVMLSNNQKNIKAGETSHLREVAYSGELGLEIGYDLGKRVSLTVEPRVKHYLNSISADPEVKLRPLQLGVYTGLTYSFN